MDQAVLTDADVFGPPAGEPTPTPPPQGDGSVVDAVDRSALNPAQTAAYHRLLANGKFDPKAPPGSELLPLHQTTEGEEPAAGKYYVDLGGNVKQAGQSSGPTPMTDADVFGAAGPSQAPAAPGMATQSDEGLGILKGVLRPLNNGASFMEWGTRKLGLPVDEINKFGAGMGLAPTLDSAKGAQEGFFARQAAQGRAPGKLGEFGGGVLATLPMIAGLGPLGGGAVSGALETNSKTPGGVLLDAGLGAAGGKIGDTVLSGVKGIVAPKLSEAVQKLLAAGVPLTPGQIAGGAAHRFEDGLTSIPILGDVIKNAQARGMVGFNTAAINRALKPIGQTLPANATSGHAAIDFAHDALGKAYDAIVPGLSAKADPAFVSNMANLKSLALNLTPDYARKFASTIKTEIDDRFAPKTGIITGDGLKAAESQLGAQAARFGKVQDGHAQDYADAVRQAQAELRALVARTNPAAADSLNAVNSGWANLVRVENAASRQGADGGVFTPAQLQGAVRATDNSVRKSSVARGGALMQDLADAGKDVLPSSVPDSGSPFRHALEAIVALLVGQEAHALPLLLKGGAAGALAGSAYTKAGQKVVTPLMTARPAWAPQAADLIERLRPLLQAGGAAAAPNTARTALPTQ